MPWESRRDDNIIVNSAGASRSDTGAMLVLSVERAAGSP